METSIQAQTGIVTIAKKNSWLYLTSPETTWLVDGLLPADGFSLICGKPKAGKSTWIRSLVAAVIKTSRFLGRSVDIPEGTGKVLYLHLDQKDKLHRVAEELRQLGITTEEEADRVILLEAKDIPKEYTFAERLTWLQQQVKEAKPNLLVIDLLWLFLKVKSANDYNAVVEGMNQVHTALEEAGYKGATLVAVHGRKAVNPDNPADDILGSTGQSGSCVTTIMLSRRRREGIYTIMTEQTVRDKVYGEIDETVIHRSETGVLSLGTRVDQIKAEEAKAKDSNDIQRLLMFIKDNSGSDIETIRAELHMSKNRALELIDKTALIRHEGDGVKGDPKRYFVDAVDPATELFARFGNKGGSNDIN